MPNNPAPRSWLKLSVQCPPQSADTVAALLSSYSPDGVEQGYSAFGEGSEVETVALYLEQNSTLAETLHEIDLALAELRRCNPSERDWLIERLEIADCDWNAVWKKEFAPLTVVPGLVIKPSWDDYQPRAGEKVIEMDPGMAFGTGHHASTRLALQLLSGLFQSDNPPTSALDLGCGTAILAMAAALWGCRTVTALDNDPLALTVARQNIAVNNLDSTIQTATPEELPLGDFEVVLANITSDVLLQLAPTLNAATRPEGHLILAGILSGEQELSITRVFRELGFKLLARPHDEEWAACLFHKPR